MKGKTYYEVLGVNKDASAEDIKKSYRELAKRCHPDRNPDDSKAEEHFKKILKAYSVLGDADERTRYDQILATRTADGGAGITKNTPARRADSTTAVVKKSPSKRTGGKAATKESLAKVSLKRRMLIVLLNLLGMVAAVTLVPYFALRWLDSYTNHNETYKVPDVCGIQLEDAIDVLAANKLNYTIVKSSYQENAQVDEVLVQYPSAGSDVKEGRKVGIIINNAEKPKRTVPSVIDNRTYREAESHIKAAGFVIGTVDSIPGEKDWVYELRYNGKSLVNGEAIPQGSTLTVIIGNGRPEAVKDEPVFDLEFDI